jgi:hypothetical protein
MAGRLSAMDVAAALRSLKSDGLSSPPALRPFLWGQGSIGFECSVCGATMESWKTAWVPSYRLIVGPVRMPDESQ